MIKVRPLHDVDFSCKGLKVQHQSLVSFNQSFTGEDYPASVSELNMV